MIIREFLTKLGFDVDDKKLNKYDKLLGVAKKATLALTASAVGLGTAVLKQADDMEQTSIAFETMLKSGEKADKLIRDLTMFASKTPFELKGLIENSKKLVAFGFEANNIVDTMTTLGNISAGIGKDKMPTLVRALGKIKTKGKATMEELNMLLEAGVPILDQLAKNLGYADDEADQLFKDISAGKIKFDDVNKAMRDMGQGAGQFSGLMIKQTKTLGGIISNVRDYIQRLAIEIGTDLLPDAKEIARTFLEWIDNNKEMIKSNIIGFLKGFAKIIGFLVKDLPKMLKTLKNILIITSPLTGAILAYVGALKLMALWQKKEAIARLFSIKVKILATKAQAVLNAVMMANPIAFIIAGIVALIAVIVLLVKHWDKVKQAIMRVWNWFSKLLDNKWIRLLGLLFAPFITVPALIIKHWDKVKAFFEGFFDWIGGAIQSVADWFGGIFDKITGFFKNIGNVIGKVGGFFKGIFGGGKKEENQVEKVANTGKRGSNKNVNVNSNISVQVPQGTSQQQEEFIDTKVKGIVSQEMNKMGNGIIANTGGA